MASFAGFGRRAQKTDIKNGSIKNGEVYFETEFGTDEDKITTIYQGKQIGDTIEGTRKRINADGEDGNAIFHLLLQRNQ